VVDGLDRAAVRAAAPEVIVFALEVADGLVQTIRSVVNPDKPGHLGPVSDLARLAKKPPKEE
jgi:hypothetical protein